MLAEQANKQKKRVILMLILYCGQCSLYHNVLSAVYCSCWPPEATTITELIHQRAAMHMTLYVIVTLGDSVNKV